MTITYRQYGNHPWTFLELVCDNVRHREGSGKAMLAASGRGDVANNIAVGRAITRGWQLNLTRGLAFCPNCNLIITTPKEHR